MVANTMRGEVEIKICGEVHQLRFTLGAMRELKERFGVKSVAEIFKNANDWGPDDIAFLFHAGLKRGSLPDASLEDIEEMMVLQELPDYAEALSRAFNAANTGKAEPPNSGPNADPTTDQTNQATQT